MTDQVKDKSFVLVNALKRFGIKLDHGKALDVMSVLNESQGWNVQAKKATSIRQLSVPEQKLLDTGVLNYGEFYRDPKPGETAKLAFAGSHDGDWFHTAVLTNVSVLSELGAAVRLALKCEPEPEEGKSDGKEGEAAEAGRNWNLFMFVTLTEKEGKWVATEWRSLNRVELFNQTFEIKLRQCNAGNHKLICPVSGAMFKTMLGIAPFLEAADEFIWDALVPDRVWGIARLIELRKQGQNVGAHYEEGTKVLVTIGEVYATYMVKREWY